jgi:hypothetical protein
LGDWSPAEAREDFSWWLVFGAAMILLANLSAEFIGRKAPADASAAIKHSPAP